MQQLTILGATGSIGRSTLDVLRLHLDDYCIFALTAHSQYQLLAQQCIEFKPQYAVIDADYAVLLEKMLSAAKCSTKVLSGKQSLDDVCDADSVDIVMAAIVGAAGLSPTMSAVKAGKKVLLANKESLVMSGHLFTAAAKCSGAQVLPVDSEHNAIFQCLPHPFGSLSGAGIDKLLLTGSGGPFRQLALEKFAGVTPQQACHHPNWSMGKKISVDSATMMNKGLEFIEACWMFHAQPHDIDILIHPQSIVHSMVQYVDGSVLAQMGQPDMKTPIAHALAWPRRIESNVKPLNFTSLSQLTFEAPDYQRFPCLALAKEAMAVGGELPAVLNAVNEVAVEHFLNERICFTDIPKLNRRVVEGWNNCEPLSLDDVIYADQKARVIANDFIAKMSS